MPNQFKLTQDKEWLIYFYVFMQHRTQRQCAKKLRLSPKTIKRFIKMNGLANYSNLHNQWYIENVYSKIPRRKKGEIK
jgi:DNA-binding MurR/RpiR family transcriptional regulator